QERPQRVLWQRLSHRFSMLRTVCAQPSSHDLPGGAVLGILDHNAHRCELISDTVRFFEVLACTRGGAVRKQAFDLLRVDAACLLLASFPVRSALRQESEQAQRRRKLLAALLACRSR